MKYEMKSSLKKVVGDNMFEIKKNPTSWLKYTKQRHKVKKIIRNDLKEEQNTVAQQYKTNPKNFGNTSILKLNTLKK